MRDARHRRVDDGAPQRRGHRLDGRAQAAQRSGFSLTDEGATVGKDKIRYLLFKRGFWRWHPRRAPLESGFRDVTLSPGLVVDGKHVPSPDDIRRAQPGLF